MTFREYLASDRDSGLDRTGIYSRHRKLVCRYVRHVLRNKEKETENPRLFKFDIRACAQLRTASEFSACQDIQRRRT